MTSTPRYTDRSEYGGSDGSNYLTPAGTPRPLSASERARLLRREMQHPGRPGESAPSVLRPRNQSRPALRAGRPWLSPVVPAAVARTARS